MPVLSKNPSNSEVFMYRRFWRWVAQSLDAFRTEMERHAVVVVAGHLAQASRNNPGFLAMTRRTAPGSAMSQCISTRRS